MAKMKKSKDDTDMEVYLIPDDHKNFNCVKFKTKGFTIKMDPVTNEATIKFKLTGFTPLDSLTNAISDMFIKSLENNNDND